MKKKILFGFLYIILSLFIVELIIKVYFITPLSKTRIQNYLSNKSFNDSEENFGNWFGWDKELNYKWKSKTNLEKLFQYSLTGNHFAVSVNDDGFRSPPTNTIELIKNETHKKIICLGESWTMGWGVNVNDSYPMQLQKLVDDQMPGSEYKVFNLGVITYSSFQGLAILNKISPYLKPGDIVVISYQANDPRNGFAGKEVLDKNKFFLEDKEFNDLVFHTENGYSTYKVVKLLSILTNIKPKSSSDFYWDFTPRVPYDEFVSNYSEMIKTAESKGASPILLYHGLFREKDYTVKGMYQAAQKNGVPLVDLYDTLQSKVNEDIATEENKFPDLQKNNLNNPGLETSTDINSTKVIFRVNPNYDLNPVSLKDSTIEKLEISMLNYQEGKLELDTFPLNDNGQGGDEIKDDGVWSGEVNLPLKLELLKLSPVYNGGNFKQQYDLNTFFFFKLTENKGNQINVFPEFMWSSRFDVPLYVNLWRGLVVGKIENINNEQLQYNELPGQKILFYKKLVTPIYLFGRQFERSEFLHPTEAGYNIFAQEVFKKIREINPR